METNSENVFRSPENFVTWHIHCECVGRCTLLHFCEKEIYGCTIHVPNYNFFIDRNTVFYLVSIFTPKMYFHCIFLRM